MYNIFITYYKNVNVSKLSGGIEMSLYEQIINHEESIAIIGLGYVGMPIAVSFAKKVKVIGFDVNNLKINLYKSGLDPTNEVGDSALKNTSVFFTSDESHLRNAKFLIVAVPTPINQDKTPNLAPVISASEIVGRNLSLNSIVVYESTVYPGVTEEICIPILEKESGLICGKDFKVGYSPERINPGDKVHRLENIKKIVSGIDNNALQEIANIYSIIIDAGVYEASSIRVAEAAKVAENSQRDINIAFMNELAMAFDCMGIDTNEVVDAMNTKWNALGFRPGLVGGHCIGVDPYYFIYQAENLGYHSQIIASGRRINDGIAQFTANAIIKQLIKADKIIRKSKVAILGITFKENCPDIRNSKVVDIVKALREYGINPIVADPWADKNETLKEYDINLVEFNELNSVDCLIFAVGHQVYKEMPLDKIISLYCLNDKKKILIDIKGIFDIKDLQNKGFIYWRL